MSADRLHGGLCSPVRASKFHEIAKRLHEEHMTGDLSLQGFSTAEAKGLALECSSFRSSFIPFCHARGPNSVPAKHRHDQQATYSGCEKFCLDGSQKYFTLSKNRRLYQVAGIACDSDRARPWGNQHNKLLLQGFLVYPSLAQILQKSPGKVSDP
jgi:hypothetical protein